MTLHGPQEQHTRFSSIIMRFFLIQVLHVTAVLLTSTSAFLLRSKHKPPHSFYSFPATSTDDVLSFPKPNLFQHERCDVRCFLISANNNEGSSSDKRSLPQAARDGISDNDKGIVYVAVDGYMSRIMEIKVKEGDSIYAIKEEIKWKGSPVFDSIAAFEMKLFESIQQTTKRESTDEDTEEPLMPVEKPMNATTPWKSEVTWGTKEQPLIVYIPQPPINTAVNDAGVRNSPWDGECRYPDQKKEGEAFVKSIIKEYVNIPNSNGMRVLHNVISLEGKGESDIVLRNITEIFWQAVIDATKDFRICAVGTPGIGKTCTSCVLIRLLLEQKKTAVFRVLGNGFVYMFIPTELGKVDVKVIRENEFDYDDENVNNDSVYYVVDPGKTKYTSCDLSSRYQGQVIIIASPDDEHWAGSEFFKGRNSKQGILMFFPVWTLQELLESSLIFLPAKSELTPTQYIEHIESNSKLIKKRFDQFGGVPRYVFAKHDEYNNQIQVQDRALADLSSEAAVYLAYSDRSAIKTQSSDLPKGILLSYALSPNDSGTYRTGYAEFASEYIYDFIVAKYMLQLWKQMINNDANFDPYLYETYVRKLFYDNAKQPPMKPYTIRDAISKKKTNLSTITLLGGCSASEKVEDIVESAVAKSMVVFHPYSTKNKLIDFIYGVDEDHTTYNCFQCTIAMIHDARFDHIYKLVSQIINRRTNNAMQTRINIFYAVPKHRFVQFATLPVDASEKARIYCREQIGDDSDLYLNWNGIVSVYVLCINPPVDPTIHL